MTYYPTLDEDLKRAKEILARGKGLPLDLPDHDRRPTHFEGGMIYGGDIFAAYKLLESFVEAIAQLRDELGRRDRTFLQTVEDLHARERLLADQLDYEVATRVVENPFDHNAECRFCDEQGTHAPDCAWARYHRE